MKPLSHVTMKELPLSERPYEKCLQYGSRALSDAELLAVIIRTGTKTEQSVELARKILCLSRQRNGLEGLFYLTIPELTSVRGIGKVKAVQIVCIAELAKRMFEQSAKREAESFTSPEQIARYFMPSMCHLQKEEIRLLLLDTRCHLIRDLVLSIGTVNTSIGDVRDIFIQAVTYHAAQFVLLHNHPGGDPSPSREDIQFTKRVKEAGSLMDIPLLDHIIIGNMQYISMKEKEII